MRDWTKTLLPASYRGVPFYVDSEELSGGRRLAKHEVAGGERTVIEDLGAQTPNCDVTAYLLGDLADVQAKALTAACALPVPGFVVLPIDGGFLAYAEGFRRSRSKDRAGYIAFDVTFIPDAADGGAVLSIGNVSSIVAAGIGLAAAALARLF